MMSVGSRNILRWNVTEVFSTQPFLQKSFSQEQIPDWEWLAINASLIIRILCAPAIGKESR